MDREADTKSMDKDFGAKATEDFFENFLKESMEYNDIPGLVMGVSLAGKNWTGAAGVRDITDGDPLKATDVFHCASISKLLTSTAIMKMVEAGILNLEDRLCDILPDLEIRDERWSDIRLFQMLSHISGMGDVEDYHWEEALTGKDALRDYVYSDEVSRLPLLWAPGEGGFRYSNVAYEILGHIVSERSGEYSTAMGDASAGKLCYEDFVKVHLLEPAGMEDSTMKTYERIKVDEGQACGQMTDAIRRENRITNDPNYRPMALPHEKLDDRSIAPVKYYPYNRAHGPSSTLTSTVLDLLKLAHWHMAGLESAEMMGAMGPGQPATTQHVETSPCNEEGFGGLDNETYRRIIFEYATVPNNGEKMGLGWFMREKHGYRLYGHEGTDDGFRASLWLCPELDLAIAVIANLSGAPVKKISKKLFDRILTELEPAGT